MEDMSLDHEEEGVLCGTESGAEDPCPMEEDDLEAVHMEELLRATLRAFRHDDDEDDGEGEERPPRLPERTTPVYSDPLGESDEDITDSERCCGDDDDEEDVEGESNGCSPRECAVSTVPLSEQLAEASRQYLIHHATRSTVRKAPTAVAPVQAPAVPKAPSCCPAAPAPAPAPAAAPAFDAAAVCALCTLPLAEAFCPPAPCLPPTLTAGPNRKAVASLLSAHAAQQASLLKARGKELARQRRGRAPEGATSELPSPDVVTTQIVFFARWHELCRRQQAELCARGAALLRKQHGDEEQRAAAAHDKTTAAARKALVKDYARRHDDPAKVLAAFDETALTERSALLEGMRARHAAEAAQLETSAAELAAKTAAHFAALRSALEAAM